MEKVKLPREVAEAIEVCRENRLNDYEIIVHSYTRGTEIGYSDVKWPPELFAALYEIQAFKNKHGGDVLFRSLAYGYEIEKSPEEKVRNYYAELVAERRMDEAVGVRRTLAALGIYIDGVNTDGNQITHT